MLNITSRLFKRCVFISFNHQKKLQSLSTPILNQEKKEFVSVECEPTENLKDLIQNDQSLRIKVERIQKEFKV
jgi:hypothetical protein